MFWKSLLERLIILTSSYFKSLSIFMKTAKRSICFPNSRKSLLPFVNHDWTNDFRSKWFSCEVPWSCQPLEYRLWKSNHFGPELTITAKGVTSLTHFFSLTNTIIDHHKLIINRGQYKATCLHMASMAGQSLTHSVNPLCLGFHCFFVPGI